MLVALAVACVALVPRPAWGVRVTNANELKSVMADETPNAVLELDIEITQTLQVTGHAVLDLNGHVLTMTGSGSVIKVSGNGASLVIRDSQPGNVHSYGLSQGGVITGGSAMDVGGGGVYVTGGATLALQSGTIYACRAKFGGGVYIDRSSSFAMSGGAIQNCEASKVNGAGGSGGVYFKGSSFTMSGGTIARSMSRRASPAPRLPST